MAYSEEEKEKIFKTIFKEMSLGSSLREVLLKSGMPSRKTFFEWIESDKEKSNHYARACEAREEVLFDEILEIADENNADVYLDDAGVVKIDGNSVNRSKLKVDARKWVLGRMNPKKYGTKHIEQTFKEEKPFEFKIIDGKDT